MRIGFPVFFGNVLKYLSGGRYTQDTMLMQPGQSVRIRTTSTAQRVTVQPPNGRKVTVERDQQNSFLFGQTGQTGIYEVSEPKDKKPSQRFAVNLFDHTESNIRPRETISTTYEEIQAQSGWEPTRRDVWKFLLLCGLVVLIFEWYIYNRRVYL